MTYGHDQSCDSLMLTNEELDLVLGGSSTPRWRRWIYLVTPSTSPRWQLAVLQSVAQLVRASASPQVALQWQWRRVWREQQSAGWLGQRSGLGTKSTSTGRRSLQGLKQLGKALQVSMVRP